MSKMLGSDDILAKRPLEGPQPIPWSELQQQWRLSSDGQWELEPLLVGIIAVSAVVAVLWFARSGLLRVCLNGMDRWASARIQAFSRFMDAGPKRSGPVRAREHRSSAHIASQPLRTIDANDGIRYVMRFQVEDLSPIDKKLVPVVAEPAQEVIERVTYYHPPDSRPQCAGMSLQLRVDEQAVSHEQVVSIAWQQRRTDHCPAHEPDRHIRLTVGEQAWADQLLEAVGFRPMLRFEIRRRQRVWKRCRVHLDRVPHLGGFIEIEGLEAQEVIDARHALGLASTAPTRQPYATLLHAYRASHPVS